MSEVYSDLNNILPLPQNCRCNVIQIFLPLISCFHIELSEHPSLFTDSSAYYDCIVNVHLANILSDPVFMKIRCQHYRLYLQKSYGIKVTRGMFWIHCPYMLGMNSPQICLPQCYLSYSFMFLLIINMHSAAK